MWHGLHQDETARTRLLHEAIDLGVTAVDTAPLYEFGGSEEHLGRALLGHRQRVCLFTKVGLRWDSDHGQILFEATTGGRRRVVRRDSRPESVRRDVESSLRRLRTDRLDLVQVHQLDDRTPVADTIGTLLRLRSEGKLRCIGVCNYPAHELRRAAGAMAGGSLASDQEHYSLVTRGVEGGVVPVLRELDIGLLAYSPLEQGVLAGRLLGDAGGAAPARNPLFQPRNARQINEALERTALPIARNHGVGLSQVALAWLLHQPAVSAVICGASRRQQLEENVAAGRLRLGDDERSYLSVAFGALELDLQAGQSRLERARRLLWRKAAGLRRRLPVGRR